jgi:hypothetical protein
MAFTADMPKNPPLQNKSHGHYPPLDKALFRFKKEELENDEKVEIRRKWSLD